MNDAWINPAREEKEEKIAREQEQIIKEQKMALESARNIQNLNYSNAMANQRAARRPNFGQRAAGFGRGVGRFAGRVNANKDSITTFFIFCLIVHIIDASTGFRRVGAQTGGIFILYVFLTLWAIFFVFKPETGFVNRRYVFMSAVWSTIAFSSSRISGFLSEIMPAKIAYMIVIFSPIWIIYLMLWEPASPPGLKRLGRWYFLFWIFLIALNYATAVDSNMLEMFGDDKVDTYAGVKEMFEFTKETWKGLGEKFGGFGGGLIQAINETWSMTQPDYYTASVDSNAEKELGVKIKKVQSTGESFYIGEDVSAFMTVQATSIADDITMRFFCIADKGKKTEIKESERISVYPETIKIFDSGVEDVDCTIGGDLLPKGTHTITMGANFDFKTESYRKIYFADYDKYKNFAREDMDFLEEHGITEPDTETIYTSGPIELGIGVRDSLIKIDRMSTDQYQKELNFGVSMKKAWPTGEIKKIKDVFLVLPAGFTIEDNSCSGGMKFEVGTCSQFSKDITCKDDISIVYKLSEEQRGFDSETSIRCKVVLPADNYDSLLGERPVTTMYFKALINYEYEVDKTVTVTIKKEEEDVLK